MRASLDDRIARATELLKTHPAARDLLTFYRELALYQKCIYEALRLNNQTDVRALLKHFPALLELVQWAGPERLAEFGAEHLPSPIAQEELLLASWEDRGGDDSAASEAGRFYARVLLQPYAEYLASRGQIDTAATEAHRPRSATLRRPETLPQQSRRSVPVVRCFQSDASCPFCGARPVAAVLRGEGDGAKRWLLCSVCSTEWPFRRVACPNCGEGDKDTVPVYTAADFDHVRVEACDRCMTYIKSVDLTRDGRAVPVVDELATVALNVWAEKQGYTKLESNLLGL